MSRLLPAAVAAACALAVPIAALDGQPGLHDPSTVIVENGNDRQAVIDDGVSKRLTLNQGANVIRAAIVNAGGATDFCARFLDANDRPIKTLTATLAAR